MCIKYILIIQLVITPLFFYLTVFSIYFYFLENKSNVVGVKKKFYFNIIIITSDQNYLKIYTTFTWQRKYLNYEAIEIV